MKRDNVNYLAVGSFVLAVLVGLVVVVYLITGRTGPADRYYVLYRHVTGLKFGTPVYYEGYQVGQVEQIRPMRRDGDLRYRVEVSVVKDWEIPRNSEARMTATGLLSAITINIHQGSSRSLLRPGDEIPGREGGDLFSVINTVASDLNKLAHTSLRPLLDNLNRQVTRFSSQLDDSAPGILASTETLLDRLNRSAEQLRVMLGPENRKRLDTTLDNFELSSENVARASANAVDVSEQARAVARDVQRTRQRVDDLLGSLQGVVDGNREHLAVALRDARRVLDVVAEHVDEITYHIQGTSRNMHEFSRQLRQNPSLLLGSKPPRDAGEEGP